MHLYTAWCSLEFLGSDTSDFISILPMQPGVPKLLYPFWWGLAYIMVPTQFYVLKQFMSEVFSLAFVVIPMIRNAVAYNTSCSKQTAVISMPPLPSVTIPIFVRRGGITWIMAPTLLYIHTSQVKGIYSCPVLLYQ